MFSLLQYLLRIGSLILKRKIGGEECQEKLTLTLLLLWAKDGENNQPRANASDSINNAIMQENFMLLELYLKRRGCIMYTLVKAVIGRKDCQGNVAGF